MAIVAGVAGVTGVAGVASMAPVTTVTTVTTVAGMTHDYSPCTVKVTAGSTLRNKFLKAAMLSNINCVLV